jgi:tripartite-type tricarboxylate transporter receptor subunit TctC
LIKEGKVRALVVSTASRVPDLPDVPTLAEAGVKNAESEIWFGVFMPAKTPGAIIEKFHAAGQRVLSDPAMQASLKKLGIETRPMKPAEIDDLVRQETASNLEIIKAADIHQ